MRFLRLLLISVLMNGLSCNLWWCGSTQTWNKRFSRVDLTDLNNATMSQYRADARASARFSLTAVVGPLLKSRASLQRKMYGQLFLKVNGDVVPQGYLLVTTEDHINHVE